MYNMVFFDFTPKDRLMKKIFWIFPLMFALISTLQASFTNVGMNVLSSKKAFNPTIKLKNNKIMIEIKLGDKIYIYKNKIKVSLLEPKQISLTKNIKFPKAEKYHDFTVYTKDFKAYIPLFEIKNKIVSNNKNIKLKLSFQGCSKLGLCYPPVDKIFDFVLPKIANSGTISKNNKKIISNENKIVQTLSKSSIWVVLVTFFGFGLLLSLTPCIFPMIPILSSIIVSQSKKNMTAKKGFFLSLVYVLSMAVAYSIAGVLAGLFGSNIQIMMQNPWVIVSFSAIFVALAFSMFGYYELQLPSSFQAKVNKTSDKMQGKGITSVAIMGFLSALIVGPCVAAPLAGALVYIGQTGNALLGGFALFIMSLGMGTPLLLVGIGAGKFMPKPGGWMENVSKVFGVVMLGVALYMLSRVISSEISMLLWAILFIGSAVYLGALEPLKDGIAGIKKMLKVMGLIFFIYGVILFVGAILGNTSPLNPLANIKSGKYQNGLKDFKNNKSFRIVKNEKEIQNILKNSNKPVILDFSAKWCMSCKELEKDTFDDPKVKDELKNFTLLRVDVTSNSNEDKRLMKKYGVFGPPVIIFFDKNHNELKNQKIVGYIQAKRFLSHIKEILR